MKGAVHERHGKHEKIDQEENGAGLQLFRSVKNAGELYWAMPESFRAFRVFSGQGSFYC